LKVVRSVAELRALGIAGCGFVPTMGAFHEGHLSLMRASAAENDVSAISIFVNPTQFGRGEDFERYPRQEERDLSMAADAGVQVAFVPPVEELYPAGDATRVEVPGLSEPWEGAHRPGHFTGVATVVNKLFNIVQPKAAYFGLKDYQQCMVIERMVTDLHMPVNLKFKETVREDDGLAMSSRNVYLLPEDRRIAPLLYEAMQSAARAARSGRPVAEALSSAIASLTGAGFEMDYLALVDPLSLQPIHDVVQDARLLAAARLGGTRLIDNLAV
jgi:pantoate--beta-alanine ligase